MKNKKIYYVKIDGIYCEHCRQNISKALLKIHGVSRLSISGNIARIECSSDNLKTDKIVESINNLGYITKDKWICSGVNKWKLQQVLILLCIAAIFLSFRYLLKAVIGYDILNVIPTIDSSITLGALFITGLMTSLHCVGMCGAINLVASTSKKNAILYNVGRVSCYTLVGAVVGGIGSILSFNKTILNIFTVIVSLAMVIMGIGMTGLISVGSLGIFHEKPKSKNAFILGVLNGFIPCAPLTAMQLYAMATASPLLGGVSMFLFGLGTVPLMLGFGFIRNLFEKKKELIQRVMAVFVILLALSMMFRGLSALGINFQATNIDLSDFNVAVIKDGEQTVETDLTYSSYGDIAVKKGIPVTFIINADEGCITGCNNEVMSTDFDFNVELVAGKNVITFIPTEVGTYTYTCWMNMIKNTIYVYE